MNLARERWIKGLPPYLGFGTLDPNSISESDGVLRATYKSGTEPVYEVRVGAERSELVEYFGGQELSRTTGRRLGEAFLFRMIGLPMEDHPRLQALFSKIRAGRNIYINFYVDLRLVTYPVGYLFVLRLPITSANTTAWAALADQLKKARESSPLKLLRVIDGYILKLTPDGEVLREEVEIAYCSSLLLNLEDALDLAWEADVVPAGKEYRLTVSPIEELAMGRLTVYPGEEARGFRTFSVPPVSRAEFEEYGLEALFREMSLKLLASSSGDREVWEKLLNEHLIETGLGARDPKSRAPPRDPPKSSGEQIFFSVPPSTAISILQPTT